MENIADALKMAGAALLFVLAFSITMIMFSQCRNTADIVYEHLQLNSFLHGMNGNQDNITRNVGIETIIPTLYRYGNQDTPLRVVIQDSSGNDLQVFDTAIESAVKSQTDIGSVYYNDYLYPKFMREGVPTYMFGAPWYNNQAKTLERINCYVTGEEPNLLRHTDIQNVYSQNNLLYYANSQNKKVYEETYVESRDSGIILIDEYGEEVVTQQPNGTFKIITYRQK